MLDNIAMGYPSIHHCNFATVGGVAVASIWPMTREKTRCNNKNGFAAMQVELDKGNTLWIVSIHLHWPWPFSQRNQISVLERELANLDGEILIGGDFNMVLWSSALRRLQAVSNTHSVNGNSYSLPFANGLMTLPIDHVFIPRIWGSGRAEQRMLLGSDHYGVFARVGPNS